MLNQPLRDIAPVAPVRVMIVDDSVVVRGLVSRWVDNATGFIVAGTAPNGRVALDSLDDIRPDIVLLDLDMPELDGLTALPMLLARRPDLSVVVVSTLTQRNAEVSLRCLALGALDCLPKPGTQREITTSLEFRTSLITKLDGLADRHRRRRARDAIPATAPHSGAAYLLPPPPTAGDAPARSPRPRALLVGASTGGPRAVIEMLSGLRRVSEQVPIFIVQHMPPIFTAVFAEQVAAETGIATREAREGEPVMAGRAYVAPGGTHMGVATRGAEVVVRLDASAPLHHCRPAVDVLFKDAARVYGAGSLAVVLTGMGSDGTEGARVLADVGATVVVQDEATSTVWGMPGSIARAGLAHHVLPLQGLAPALDRLVARRGA